MYTEKNNLGIYNTKQFSPFWIWTKFDLKWFWWPWQNGILRSVLLWSQLCYVALCSTTCRVWLYYIAAFVIFLVLCCSVALCCVALLRVVISYCIAWCYILLCYILYCDYILRCTIRQGVALCCIALLLCYLELQCKLYCMVLHCIALYNVLSYTGLRRHSGNVSCVSHLDRKHHT